MDEWNASPMTAQEDNWFLVQAQSDTWFSETDQRTHQDFVRQQDQAVRHWFWDLFR